MYYQSVSLVEKKVADLAERSKLIVAASARLHFPQNVTFESRKLSHNLSHVAY
jgi:hypothetical protein